MSKEIEIGYVCFKGHYVFDGDEEGCASKRVAGIYVRQSGEVDIPDEEFQEIISESQASVLRKIAFWRKG